MNKITLNIVEVNIARINIIGDNHGGVGVEAPPESDITDALLMDDGSLFLMEDGTYFELEKESDLNFMSVPQVDKSFLNI